MVGLGATGCDALLDDTEPLEGTFVRVSSNNTPNDCVQIVISGDEGLVLTNPRGALGLDSGDVLWRQIEDDAEADMFTLEVRGSDGNYYPATLERASADRLELTIDAGGAGNTQRWVRPELADLTSCASAASLDGSWERTQSNNTAADGMIILVDGATATVTDRAGSSYSNSETLWRSIAAGTTAETFTLDVLGSDGNYYDAVITLDGTNRLELDIASTGAGNDQTWERR